MLHDLLRHGVLAEHAGRYRVRQVDALHPETLLADVGFGVNGAADVGHVFYVPGKDGHVRNVPHNGRLRAVFLNYLLDCLPAAVLELDGAQVRQLCVRTCVARSVRLAEYTDLTPEQLRQRAQSNNPRARTSCWRSTACSPRSTIIGPSTPRRCRTARLPWSLAAR